MVMVTVTVNPKCVVDGGNGEPALRVDDVRGGPAHCFCFSWYIGLAAPVLFFNVLL